VLDDWGSVPGRGIDGIFSLHHHVQTASGAYPASYPISNGGCFLGGKVTKA